MLIFIRYGCFTDYFIYDYRLFNGGNFSFMPPAFSSYRSFIRMIPVWTEKKQQQTQMEISAF